MLQSWWCFLLLPLAVHGFQPTAFQNFEHNRRITMSLSKKKNLSFQHNVMPKLIVLDLDNTVWTPELYQLRKLQRANLTPVAGKDVKLFEGSRKLIENIRKGEYPNTKFAIASRTKSVEWAHNLLKQFGIVEIMDYIEIFPGNKKAHFENIQQSSGIAYKDMLFLDDARDGKYGNCEPVSELGVLSAHVPSGITSEGVFNTALQRFAEWDGKPNCIVEWDGTLTKKEALPEERQQGTVKMVNDGKGYGFIRYGDRNTQDLFFHFNNLPDGVMVQKGDALSFTVQRSPRNGKLLAADIQVGGTKKNIKKDNAVQVRVFSMNMPFAALLANGYKNLESRNGTMFVPYPEGTKMLLHVGRRIYPDGNKHIGVMKSGGLNDAEIDKLKSLPPGFDRGMAVAICELGKTYETTVAERSDPEMQRRIAALGTDSGRIVTEIKRVDYLKRPLTVSGQGGVFKVSIDPSILPDGWEVFPATGTAKGKEAPDSSSGNEKKLVYSISG